MQAAPTHPQWLTKWLRSPHCQPPCWEQIIPGVTSFHEAKALLEQNADVTDVRPQWSELIWTMHNGGGRITTEHGVVNSIMLDVNSNAILSINQVAVSYGRPSEWRIDRCIDAYCEVDLAYPSQGMVLGLLLPHGDYPYKLVMSAYTHLGRITFFGDMKSYYDSSPWGEPNIFFQWTGYGVIQSLTSPPHFEGKCRPITYQPICRTLSGDSRPCGQLPRFDTGWSRRGAGLFVA